MMWSWCGCLSGVRCRLFAYGPADATAIQNIHFLPDLNPDWFYLFWYRLSQVILEKRPLNWCRSSSNRDDLFVFLGYEIFSTL